MPVYSHVYYIICVMSLFILLLHTLCLYIVMCTIMLEYHIRNIGQTDQHEKRVCWG